jgi:hypothetical protein
MDHPRIRRKEFQLLKDWGVKGVKVDFFQSDKQNVMGLYRDILEDAADFQIMVNFHGCTLPRGWSRTYPHLMSMEAVRGAECYSFDKRFTEKAPSHNATLPFTRNAVGPMDYTPVLLKDNVYPHITTNAHELALAVVFESGWLHFADGPEVYRGLPEAPREYLERVPAAWDETRCLDGEPARYVVMARRNGSDWFVGGISGEGQRRELEVALSFLGPGSFCGTLILDGAAPRSLESRKQGFDSAETLRIALPPYGGFVLELRPGS